MVQGRFRLGIKLYGAQHHPQPYTFYLKPSPKKLGRTVRSQNALIDYCRDLNIPTIASVSYVASLSSYVPTGSRSKPGPGRAGQPKQYVNTGTTTPRRSKASSHHPHFATSQTPSKIQKVEPPVLDSNTNTHI